MPRGWDRRGQAVTARERDMLGQEGQVWIGMNGLGQNGIGTDRLSSEGTDLGRLG